MISHLSPSIVCYNGSFQETAKLLNALGCRRAHIDVTAGYSIHGLFRYETFTAEDRSHFTMEADLHIFDFRRRWQYKSLQLRQDDCAILHIFPWVSHRKIEKALESGFPNGIKRGLSLDVQTPLSRVTPFFPLLDVLMIMGIEIGGRGVPLNDKAIKDLYRAKEIASAAGKTIRLVIDGGVSAKTFTQLSQIADTLVIGGLLFNSPDIAAQWMELNRWLKEAKHE